MTSQLREDDQRYVPGRDRAPRALQLDLEWRHLQREDVAGSADERKVRDLVRVADRRVRNCFLQGDNITTF